MHQTPEPTVMLSLFYLFAFIYTIGCVLAYAIAKFYFLHVEKDNLAWTKSSRKMAILVGLFSWLAVLVILLMTAFICMAHGEDDDHIANW